MPAPVFEFDGFELDVRAYELRRAGRKIRLQRPRRRSAENHIRRRKRRSPIQGGGWEIWRTRPEGGVPMQVTRHGGREAFEAPNGEFLFYTKAPPAAGIWWISCRNGGCDGGDETKISGAGKQGKWAVGGRGIYYLNGPDDLVFQEFAGKRQTPISMPGLGFVAGVAAAPDDSSVLLTALVRYEVHLMLVRGFR